MSKAMPHPVPSRASLGPAVSVVVTTCACSARVVRCVEAILAGGYGPLEIVVVENRPQGSPTHDALVERFGTDPRIRYVEEPVAGLSRARNTGLVAASGALVVFTDDDVVPAPQWLPTIVAAFEDPDVACVTGLIQPLALETPAQVLFERLAGFGKGDRPQRHSLASPPAGDVLFPFAPGAFGSGANTALRADVARAMNGFDERLGAGTAARGGEDLDCFIRVLLDGGTIAYEPEAVVFHEHPADDHGLRRRAFGYGVGLTAMLTKQLVHGPGRLRLLRAVPAGIRYALDPASRKRASRGATYPRRLSVLELLGAATGPLAYLLSMMRSTPSSLAVPESPATSPEARFVRADVGPVDLDALPETLTPRVARDGHPYDSLLALVRLHGDPLGTVELPYRDGELRGSDLREAAWDALGAEIDAHARRHGCMTTPVSRRDLCEPPPVAACAGALDRRADAPFVSLIVPTAGRPERIDACLESLLAVDYPSFEVLMVDNAPADGRTREAIERWAAKDSRVRYVAEPLPGSSVARNRGIREARAELLTFTDDDVALDPDWLWWMVDPFLRDAEVGVVCGLVMPARMDTPEQRWFEEFSGFGKGFDRRAFDLHANRADERVLYPYWGGVFGSGNSMAFRRSVLLDIGGFDPALGAGSPARAGADIESYSHAILRGSRLVYEPRAVCWHDHRAHEEALRKQTYSYGVGFTAILTKWLLRDPHLWAEGGRALAAFLRTSLRRGPAGAPAEQPHEIARLGKQLKMSHGRGKLVLQLRGYAAGPFLYAKSVAWARRRRLRDVLEGRDG